MNIPLYPLKFNTIFKDKIWGGNKINTVLGKDFSPLPNCGETWEVSGVPGNVSVVKEGPLAGKSLTELLHTYKGELAGEKVYAQYKNEFPLLVKFIDANDDLSIQVHPNDELAGQRHQCSGKTEMWYVFQADKGARLNVGFDRPLDKKTYLEYFNTGRLDEILNYEEVKAGDVYFLPSGRIHYIGKGVLLAEIQQSSDITYRIYDFDRTDGKGNKRELHTEQALDALDFTHYPQYKSSYTEKLNEATPLVTCDYFQVNLIRATSQVNRNFSSSDSFVIYLCCEGNSEIHYSEGIIPIEKGEAVLIPASIKEVQLKALSESILLESYCR